MDKGSDTRVNSEYYLEGEALANIVELAEGVNVIGKKQISIESLSKQELEIEVKKDGSVLASLGSESTVIISLRRLESGEIVGIQKKQVLTLQEGDTLLITKKQYPLTLMKRLTSNTFTRSRLQGIASWLRSLPSPTQPIQPLEPQKFQDYKRRLDYRIQQSKYRRMEDSKISTNHKDSLFASLGFLLFDSYDEVNSLRLSTVQWLRAYPNYLIVFDSILLVLFFFLC